MTVGFLSAFAQASSKLVVSCGFFFPQKETQPLFPLLEMGKPMLNALLVVLLSPEQGGLMTFCCKAAFFQEATEAAFNSRGGIS